MGNENQNAENAPLSAFGEVNAETGKTPENGKTVFVSRDTFFDVWRYFKSQGVDVQRVLPLQYDIGNGKAELRFLSRTGIIAIAENQRQVQGEHIINIQEIVVLDDDWQAQLEAYLED